MFEDRDLLDPLGQEEGTDIPTDTPEEPTEKVDEEEEEIE